MIKTKIKLDESLFYIGLLTQLLFTAGIITINSYAYSALYAIVSIVCFGSAILIDGFKRREFTLFLILAATSLIHLLVVGDTNLLRLVMLVFAGRRVDTKKLKKFLVIAYIGMFVVTIMLSVFTDFNDVYQSGVWRISKGWETRYTLGFDGATRMMFIWICCIVSVQILTEKVCFLRDAIFLMISCYLFKLSVSYTGIILSVVVIGCPYIIQHWIEKKKSMLIKYVICGAIISVILLTILASVIDMSRTALGLFLNGRTGSLYHLISIGEYPSIFGGKLPVGSKGLDNSYFYCSYILGILPMTFMVLAIIRLGKVFYRKKDIMGCACTICFILIAYVTQTFEHPFLNYFLFLIIENWNDFFLFGLSKREEIRRKTEV